MIDALKKHMVHTINEINYRVEDGCLIVPHDGIHQGIFLARLAETDGPVYTSIADFFVALQTEIKAAESGDVIGADYRGRHWRFPQ